MAASVEKITEHFDQFGWQYEFDAATRTWVTGFRGESSNFNILVHLTENWLYFIISPFVNGARTELCQQRLNDYLLRLNHTINMAKFSIDGDGDVVLTVELPTETLSYSEFCDGLNAMSYYADGYYVDVLNLAQDPSYEPEQIVEEEWLPADDSPDDGADKPN